MLPSKHQQKKKTFSQHNHTPQAFCLATFICSNCFFPHNTFLLKMKLSVVFKASVAAFVKIKIKSAAHFFSYFSSTWFWGNKKNILLRSVFQNKFRTHCTNTFSIQLQTPHSCIILGFCKTAVLQQHFIKLINSAC